MTARTGGELAAVCGGPLGPGQTLGEAPGERRGGDPVASRREQRPACRGGPAAAPLAPSASGQCTLLRVGAVCTPLSSDSQRPTESTVRAAMTHDS